MWYNAVKVQADCWDTELRSGSSKEDPTADKNQCKPQSSRMWISQEPGTDVTVDS